MTGPTCLSPSSFPLWSHTCWDSPARLDFGIHRTPLISYNKFLCLVLKAPIAILFSLLLIPVKSLPNPTPSQRILRWVSIFYKTHPWWGEGGKFFLSTNISLLIVSLNNAPPHYHIQLLRHFIQKWKSASPPSSSTLQGCWMIFKLDSLGKITKQIKVCLLNGLTCRRAEDKQEAQ